MSSKKYGRPLHLEPRSSQYFAMALFVLHGMALVVATNLTIPGWMSIVLSVVVLANFYTTFNIHILGRGPNAILSMVWDNDGEWKVINGQGEELEVSLLPSSYVHQYLVVLNFLINKGGRRTAILLRDSLDPKTFRELLVRMRIEADS
ncbi:MAG TPA: hypothetical protein ENI65_11150 [Gammaproteobacteria bacterium]|nr:hypothetical protein [Gammaproteobacteria bacterium]